MVAKRVLFVTPSPKKRARTMRVTMNRVKNMKRTLSKKRRSRKNTRLTSARSLTGLRTLGKPQSKNVLQVDQSATVGTRVWSSTDLCAIPYSATNVVNARCGQDAHISGFMHRAIFVNNLNTPMKIYELWLVPKFYTEDGLTPAQLQADMYSRHGLATDKDASWTDTTASILYDEPINSSKFALLKKRTFILGSSGVSSTSQTNTGSAKCYKQEKLWIPLNRKYTYGSLADGETEIRSLQAPVFYVTWACGVSEDNGAVSVGSALKRQIHSVTYFRDGESGM